MYATEINDTHCLLILRIDNHKITLISYDDGVFHLQEYNLHLSYRKELMIREKFVSYSVRKYTHTSQKAKADKTSFNNKYF